MKRLNEWIALLTNIGLLFGIVFLVYELDQNSLNQQMEARFFIAESFSDFNSSVAENPQLASLLTKAEESETELTPAETRQYFHHYARWMQILNRASEMHQEGVLSDGAWREYICEINSYYSTTASTAFRNFIETVHFLSEDVYSAIVQKNFCQ